MYSLGLILFDLIYPMKTLMEKHKLFDNVKKGIIPIVIKEKLPLIYNLLLSLINDDPSSRPKACEIIILIREFINQCHKQQEINVPISSKKNNSFFFKDIHKIKSHKLLMKLDECSTWKIV